MWFSELNGQYLYITVCETLLFCISLTQHVSRRQPGWVGLCPFWSGSWSEHRGWSEQSAVQHWFPFNNTFWLWTHLTDFVHCWGCLYIKSRPLFLGVTGLELVTHWFVCRALLDGHTLMSCLIRAAVLYVGDFHITVRRLLQLLLWSSPSW